jgi:uncharacterized membrane protein YfhO
MMAIFLLINNKVRIKRQLYGSILIIVVSADMLLNGILVFHGMFTTTNADAYSDYVQQENTIISNLKNQDESIFYRTEQTQNRGSVTNPLAVFYDESMAYNWLGLSHYTSTFNSDLNTFMSRLGYFDGTSMTIYRDPILSSDSLLGVKYLLSGQNYPGYTIMSDSIYNNKSIYVNDYALSLGFLASTDLSSTSQSCNPFEYQNQIFSSILGRQIQLYKQIEVFPTYSEQGMTIVTEASNDTQNILYFYARVSAKDLPLSIDGLSKFL